MYGSEQQLDIQRETQGEPGAGPLSSGRTSGVLLHLTCLPSAYGIGDMGGAAYRFADQLQAAGQRYWQILPLNPSNPSSGESPYFSSSAFAGNPLLLDLEALSADGLLFEEELTPPENLPDTEVDFSRVREFKLATLYKACNRFLDRGDLSGFQNFCDQHAEWLEDFALFTALSQQHGSASWAEWPQALRDREPNAVNRARAELTGKIKREKVLQYFFFQQWQSLKRYCNDRGLLIFGDMPIYVSYESADVWANTELFKLDQDKSPTVVSGVPPDYFSATGQLWNNPVYNWEALRAQGYAWWVKRMGALFECFDIVRIDHFRGLVQYWEVPANSENAIMGSWQDVPGYELFDTLLAAYPQFPAVVEDLGIITPDVVELKEHYGFPGMLIMQFAFEDESDSNPYKPDNHRQSALVYLGSHDNTTGLDWIENADATVRKRLEQYVGADSGKNALRQLLQVVLSSKADIAIITAQDLLGLPGRARMNDPATNEGNWRWRLTEQEFAAIPMDDLRDLTNIYGRLWNE